MARRRKTKKKKNLEKNQTRKITKRSLIYKQFQGLNVAWTKMTNILNGEEKNKKEEKRVKNECNVKLFRSIFNWALELNSKTQLHRMNECNAHLWTMWKTSSRYFCAFCPYHFGIEQTHRMAIAKQAKNVKSRVRECEREKKNKWERKKRIYRKPSWQFHSVGSASLYVRVYSFSVSECKDCTFARTHLAHSVWTPFAVRFYCQARLANGAHKKLEHSHKLSVIQRSILCATENWSLNCIRFVWMYRINKRQSERERDRKQMCFFVPVHTKIRCRSFVLDCYV